MFVRSLYIALAIIPSFPTFSFSQAKIVIDGVDARVAPLEGEFLAKQAENALRQAARAAALLAIEKQDRQEAEDRAAVTKAWLDQSWKQMEYWRAYAGFNGD